MATSGKYTSVARFSISGIGVRTLMQNIIMDTFLRAFALFVFYLLSEQKKKNHRNESIENHTIYHA